MSYNKFNNWIEIFKIKHNKWMLFLSLKSMLNNKLRSSSEILGSVYTWAVWPLTTIFGVQGCSWLYWGYSGALWDDPGCSGVFRRCSGGVLGCSGCVPGCSGVFRVLQTPQILRCLRSRNSFANCLKLRGILPVTCSPPSLRPSLIFKKKFCQRWSILNLDLKRLLDGNSFQTC